jgi:hypothetical protein
MSRYTILPRPEIQTQCPHVEIFVGFDPPLHTFFGQVVDPSRPAGQPEAVFWIGTAPQEYPDLIAFARAMEPWAPIPMRVLAALARDRMQADPPTPFQQALLHMTSRDMEHGGVSADAAEEPMTQEAYRATGGGQCPVCQSTHIAYNSFDTESGLVSQRCVCQDCEAAWDDMYRLAGYVRKGAEGNQDWAAFETTAIVADPTPQTRLYVVTYGHKHGTAVSVYSTEAKAQAAMADIKAEYPDEFDEDDPRSWLALTESTLDG